MDDIFLMILWLVVLLSVGVSIYLPIRAIRKWEGGWRVAAYFPLAIIVIVLTVVIVGKGGNLFPIVIILYSIISLMITTVIYAIRWCWKQRRKSRE